MTEETKVVEETPAEAPPVDKTEDISEGKTDDSKSKTEDKKEDKKEDEKGEKVGKIEKTIEPLDYDQCTVQISLTLLPLGEEKDPTQRKVIVAARSHRTLPAVIRQYTLADLDKDDISFGYVPELLPELLELTKQELLTRQAAQKPKKKKGKTAKPGVIVPEQKFTLKDGEAPKEKAAPKPKTGDQLSMFG